MICLDTSFLIQALVRGSAADKQLRSWLGGGVPLAMSAIVWTEFLCGAVDAHGITLAARVVPRVLPFAPADAELAAKLFNVGGRRRGSLADCMIAATAIGHEASLATENPDDFRRFEPSGLKLVA